MEDIEIILTRSRLRRLGNPYMSNTCNLSPIDRSAFRWRGWTHGTNMFSIGEIFCGWKINDVMIYGKQTLVNVRLTSLFTVGQMMSDEHLKFDI